MLSNRMRTFSDVCYGGNALVRLLQPNLVYFIIDLNNNNNNNNTLEPLETQYLFQRLSISLQRGNEIAFGNTFTTE